MNDIENRIKRIEERNRKVELDKAWEVSWVRKIIIALITYLFIGLYLMWLDVDRPWLNALVPVLAFVISTLVVERAKQSWTQRSRK